MVVAGAGFGGAEGRESSSGGGEQEIEDRASRQQDAIGKREMTAFLGLPSDEIEHRVAVFSTEGGRIEPHQESPPAVHMTVHLKPPGDAGRARWTLPSR